MQNIEITNHGDALTVALILAVTAPSDEQSKEAAQLAEFIASTMSKKEVDICKKAAEVVIELQH
tara:strand:+ start:316 stop:507 length:192 start_codon:yes stop_codon:yes gene_type:complete